MEEGTTKDLSTLVSFRLERECCKLFHSSNQKPQAWEQMASIILKYTTLSNPAIPTGADYLQICELNSRSLCGLVKWLTVDYRSAVPYLKQARGTDLGDMSNLAKSLFMLLEMEQNGSLQGLGLGMYIQQVPGSSGGKNEWIVNDVWWATQLLTSVLKWINFFDITFTILEHFLLITCKITPHWNNLKQLVQYNAPYTLAP